MYKDSRGRVTGGTLWTSHDDDLFRTVDIDSKEPLTGNSLDIQLTHFADRTRFNPLFKRRISNLLEMFDRLRGPAVDNLFQYPALPGANLCTSKTVSTMLTFPHSSF